MNEYTEVYQCKINFQSFVFS